MRTCAILGLCLLLTLGWAMPAAGDGCYRPFQGHVGTGYGPAVVVQPTATYHAQPYYVPQVIEVQVYKDRFYSLSDLYRDRLLLENFDLLKEIRARPASHGEPAEEPPAKPTRKAAVSKPAASLAKPAAAKAAGATSKAAAKVLAESCLSCHGQGDARIDLSNVDAVSSTLRWAAFGQMAAGDMPKPPKDLVGNATELAAWKKEHALSEADLKAVYDGWVLVGQFAKR